MNGDKHGFGIQHEGDGGYIIGNFDQNRQHGLFLRSSKSGEQLEEVYSKGVKQNSKIAGIEEIKQAFIRKCKAEAKRPSKSMAKQVNAKKETITDIYE